MDVRAVRKEDLDDIGMLLGHRPHERRLAAGGARIHAGAPRQQLFDDGRIA
jgi:hypothetical protein